MEKEIKGLLQSKLEKIQNMNQHTQSIYESLEKEDTNKLVEILKIRQQLMAEIDSIDSQLLSLFKGDFEEFLKYISSQNKELKKIYSDTATLIKKIKVLDDKNSTSARELLSKIRGDIGNLKQAKNALKGYGIIGKSSNDGAFIDTKK